MELSFVPRTFLPPQWFLFKIIIAGYNSCSQQKNIVSSTGFQINKSETTTRRRPESVKTEVRLESSDSIPGRNPLRNCQKLQCHLCLKPKTFDVCVFLWWRFKQQISSCSQRLFSEVIKCSNLALVKLEEAWRERKERQEMGVGRVSAHQDKRPHPLVKHSTVPLAEFILFPD